MTGYATRLLSVHLGGHDYRIRALSDTRQFSDPDGIAERAGISSSQWPLFGQIWPSGRVLAKAMCTHEIASLRILELGCGLALSSLVLQHRGADITASDRHPLADSFLADNATRNGLPPIRYHDLPWETIDTELGRFDLIIGSDILYEREHAKLLAALVERHAQPASEIVISDPGRGNASALNRALAAQGFVLREQRCRFKPSDVAPFRGRLLHYRRMLPAVA